MLCSQVCAHVSVCVCAGVRGPCRTAAAVCVTPLTGITPTRPPVGLATLKMVPSLSNVSYIVSCRVYGVARLTIMTSGPGVTGYWPNAWGDIALCQNINSTVAKHRAGLERFKCTLDVWHAVMVQLCLAPHININKVAALMNGCP